MEFGKKLKTVREEKGMTQQTLAEHLFVTRQAVSRWESGSRYPDLMTSKKIADFLEISLDELVSGDDWKYFAEKQPIIENAKTGRIQTAVYAVSFILWMLGMAITLTEVIWIIYTGKTSLGFWIGYTEQSGDVVKCVGVDILTLFVSAVILCFLAYGTVMSVKKSVDPKIAGSIIGCFCAERICRIIIGLFYVFRIAGEVRNDVMALMVIRMIVYLTGFIFVCLFFFTKSKLSPWTVYLSLGIIMVYYLVRTISDMILELQLNSDLGGFSAESLLQSLTIVFIMGLGIVQAWIISRKRKLSTAYFCSKKSYDGV